VPELSGNELLKQRMLGAASDRDVAAVGQGNESEGVLETLRRGHVSGDYRDGANLELRRMEGEHEGHGVVGAGVGVKDNLLGCGGCAVSQCSDEQKQEQRSKKRKAGAREFQKFSPELIRDSLASRRKACQLSKDRKSWSDWLRQPSPRFTTLMSCRRHLERELQKKAFGPLGQA
jgi:hypothetical protein